MKTVTRLPGPKAPVLLRADSAYYGFATMNAALKAGADMSITARQDHAVKRAIQAIPSTAWTTINYTDAIFDDTTGTWISKAEVAEVPFTAFTSRAKKDQTAGRLVVRRIPELNKKDLEHPTLFDTHRFHASFTTGRVMPAVRRHQWRRKAIASLPRERKREDLAAAARVATRVGAIDVERDALRRREIRDGMSQDVDGRSEREVFGEFCDC